MRRMRKASPVFAKSRSGALKYRSESARVSSGFAPIHLLPHAIGFLLFLICAVLPCGADYKGAWIFLLAPAIAPRSAD